MGLLFTLPQGKSQERTLQLNFGVETVAAFLPAEWHSQSIIQLTWPHEGTDWAPMLDEVDECYVNLAVEIARRQHLLVVTPEPDRVENLLRNKVDADRLHIVECPTNDTWARDHAFITMLTEQGPLLLDFCFNGWGMKFAANHDNRINRQLFASNILTGAYRNCLDFVLEGGSIESDGRGTLLTTSACLLAPNRNETKSQKDIEDYLKSMFHLEQILWLDHGHLAGDDTDSHVDTLARMCPNDTIAYVKCTDPSDAHYEDLARMEEQLKAFRTLDGRAYRLLPLPMPDAIEHDGERLPATYANFLIMNDAVLYPTYNQPQHDAEAAEVLSAAFPGYDIVGIDCRALIKQHGSLHCVTMQYPAGCFAQTLREQSVTMVSKEDNVAYNPDRNMIIQ